MAGTNMSVDVDKKVKALRKKLSQIEKLKGKGGPYTAEEETKLASEAQLLSEVAYLENGELPPPCPEVEEGGGEEPDQSGVVEDPSCGKTRSPLEEMPPAEVEKRVRALKKKLGQITHLKEKKGVGLTKEETEKLHSEPTLLDEVFELEVVLLDSDGKKQAKVLHKKLKEIEKLRERGGALTGPEKEKMGKAKAIRAELDALLASRAPVVQSKVEAVAAPTPKVQAPAKFAAPTSKVQAAPPPAIAEAHKREVQKREAAAVAAQVEAVTAEAAETQLYEPWTTGGIFEAEGEGDEAEGFVEARSRRSKGKAKKDDAGHDFDAPARLAEEDEVGVNNGWEAPSAPPAEATPSPKQPKQDRAQDAGAGPQTPEKRIKALRKKLTQIEHLKARGGHFTKEEADKIAAEHEINEEIEALERGDPWPNGVEEAKTPPEPQEAVPEPVPEPVVEEVDEAPPSPPQAVLPELSGAEAEKRIKALNKKLKQIDALRERGPPFSAEETLKLEAEVSIKKEVKLLQNVV